MANIGYARCSTLAQDLTAQRQALAALGILADRIYLDKGLTGTSRARPGLDQALAAARRDSALGVELLEARRLVKGYSDTHDAGEGRFSRLMATAARLEGRADAADWVRRMRQAALADAEGRALADTIKTIESFL